MSGAVIIDELGEYPDEILGGVRRSAEVNCHVVQGRRWGRAAVVLTLMGAGHGLDLAASRLVNAAPPRPVKHWVEAKDWTQRQKRRPRR